MEPQRRLHLGALVLQVQQLAVPRECVAINPHGLAAVTRTPISKSQRANSSSNSVTPEKHSNALPVHASAAIIVNRSLSISHRSCDTARIRGAPSCHLG